MGSNPTVTAILEAPSPPENPGEGGAFVILDGVSGNAAVTISSAGSAVASRRHRRPASLENGPRVSRPRFRERNSGLNSFHDRVERLMLPESKDGPARIAKRPCHGDITFTIPFELDSPVVRVGRWLSSVFGACVPEAPIDHDRQSASREGDVDSSAGHALDLVVDAKAETSAV